VSEPGKVAVIDLGSNSFRLVVFSHAEPDVTVTTLLATDSAKSILARLTEQAHRAAS